MMHFSDTMRVGCGGGLWGWATSQTQCLQVVAGGREVHSYKGDSINSFDLADRIPRPQRLVEAYFHSAATLHYARGLLGSEFSDVRHPRCVWVVACLSD